MFSLMDNCRDFDAGPIWKDLTYLFQLSAELSLHFAIEDPLFISTVADQIWALEEFWMRLLPGHVSCRSSKFLASPVCILGIYATPLCCSFCLLCGMLLTHGNHGHYGVYGNRDTQTHSEYSDDLCGVHGKSTSRIYVTYFHQVPTSILKNHYNHKLMQKTKRPDRDSALGSAIHANAFTHI